MAQCDRNLPVCNHCAGDEGVECNYTPKKRHKVPSDHAATVAAAAAATTATIAPAASASATASSSAVPKERPAPYTAKTASFLISDMPNEESYTTGNWIAEHPESAKGKLPSGMYEIYSDGSPGSDDDSADGVNTPKHRPPYDSSTWNSRARSMGSSASKSCTFDNKLLPGRHLDPWYHSTFAPLPRSILQGIRTVNPTEMPTRPNYDEALNKFLAELPAELREIAAFTPETYADLARAVVKGDFSTLTPRVTSWVQYHHVRPGSRKYHLLLLPREAYFSIRGEKEEKLWNEFIAEVDGEIPTSKSSATSLGHGPGQHVINSHEGVSAFLRVPVSTQIYDILVYAHKNHASTTQTLAQVRQAGIVRV